MPMGFVPRSTFAFGVTLASPVNGRGLFIPDRMFYFYHDRKFTVGDEYSQPMNHGILPMRENTTVRNFLNCHISSHNFSF